MLEKATTRWQKRLIFSKEAPCAAQQKNRFFEFSFNTDGTTASAAVKIGSYGVKNTHLLPTMWEIFEETRQIFEKLFNEMKPVKKRTHFNHA